MTAPDERPRNVTQAEGLRRLADLVEANAEFAASIDWALDNIFDAVTTSSGTGGPREQLLAFHAALTEAGIEVVIQNDRERCTVVGLLGSGARVIRSAEARAMAGQRPSVPQYEPLVLP